MTASTTLAAHARRAQQRRGGAIRRLLANGPHHDRPKGLIRESYRIDGITDAECRSILIDWALSLPDGQDQNAALAEQLAMNGPENPDHPMTALLREGLESRARNGQAGANAADFILCPNILG